MKKNNSFLKDFTSRDFTLIFPLPIEHQQRMPEIEHMGMLTFTRGKEELYAYQLMVHKRAHN